MPELPEAETIARGLSEAAKGVTLVRVRLLRGDFLKTGAPAGLARLRGVRVRGVGRRGKCLVMDLGAKRLVIQLGMSGRIYVQDARDPLPPHTHLVLELTGGRQIRCANARRIASGVHLLAAGAPGPLAGLGPEADAIGREDFVRRLSGRRTVIKAALMNQSVLAGVGNIYSDESLFRAGIRPTRRTDRVAPVELARLHRCLRAVLREAISAGGSTLRGSNAYAGVGGELGYFSERHRVYGRYGRPCRRCRTPLVRVIIGGRGGTYCPRCQR